METNKVIMQIRTYREKEVQINMKPKKEKALLANVSVCNIVLMEVAKCNFPSRCSRLLTVT